VFIARGLVAARENEDDDDEDDKWPSERKAERSSRKITAMIFALLLAELNLLQ
jgi:hypothetical protein